MAVFCAFTNGQIVDSIALKGLKRTRPDIVQRYLDSKVGQEFNEENAQHDVQAILNTRVFSQASYELKSIDGKNILEFDCKEIITLLPTLNFGTIGSNTFLKIGGFNANLFGKIGTLRAHYIFYDGHSFFIENETPYINGSPFGLMLDLKSVSTLEVLNVDDMSLSCNYRNNYFGADGFYELEQNHRVYAGGALFNERFSINSDMATDSTHFVEGTKVKFKLEHRMNNVNINGCNEFGLGLQTQVSMVNTRGYKPFFQIIHSFKYIKQFGHGSNLATRLKLGTSTDQMTPFAPFTVDSYLNIRGVGNKIDRGVSQCVLNVEYRQELFHGKSIILQGIAFTDLGSWRLPGETYAGLLQKKNLKSFSGLGARVFLTNYYQLILRGDIGFNLQDLSQRGVVIGLGQYF